MRRMTFALGVVALIGFNPVVQVVAQEHEHAGHALGTVDFPVSCSEPARVEFNRAIALLHHMTYPQAREAFEQVAKTDPNCAMAYWGIAMTLFQPLWPTRPGPEELRQGLQAVQKARSLAPPTRRERLFVEAVAAFFDEPEATNYWQRIRQWEQAMGAVYTSFPEDPETSAFYALAHLATTPADKITRTHSDRAAELLLSVYQQNPNHPGAMHYLVHANDMPGRERESLEIIRKYESIAPMNPHALHMPTHIYTRLGDWDAVIRGNLKAAEAALKYPAGDQGQFVWDEFPHAIEYLIYAYLQKGDDTAAATQLKRLRETTPLQPSFKTAFHLASTQARFALEQRDWHEARSLAPRDQAGLDWDKFTWPEAVTWFARGLGAAHEGALEEARVAQQRLQELETASKEAGEDLFTRNIRVLRLEQSAWLAFTEDNRERSLALMREAVDLEVSTPKHAVTPGPTLPAYELLGDLLLKQSQPAEARDAYQRSLELYPRRFHSLLGAAQASRAAGDVPEALQFYQQLLEVAGRSSRASVLEEARVFVKQHL